MRLKKICGGGPALQPLYNLHCERGIDPSKTNLSMQETQSAGTYSNQQRTQTQTQLQTHKHQNDKTLRNTNLTHTQTEVHEKQKKYVRQRGPAQEPTHFTVPKLC